MQGLSLLRCRESGHDGYVVRIGGNLNTCRPGSGFTLCRWGAYNICCAASLMPVRKSIPALPDCVCILRGHNQVESRVFICLYALIFVSLTSSKTECASAWPNIKNICLGPRLFVSLAIVMAHMRGGENYEP